MSSEPALRTEQEVLARFQDMRQNVTSLFSKLSDVEQGTLGRLLRRVVYNGCLSLVSTF